jgi:hypothetical protein
MFTEEVAHIKAQIHHPKYRTDNCVSANTVLSPGCLETATFTSVLSFDVLFKPRAHTTKRLELSTFGK